MNEYNNVLHLTECSSLKLLYVSKKIPSPLKGSLPPNTLPTKKDLKTLIYIQNAIFSAINIDNIKPKEIVKT